MQEFDKYLDMMFFLLPLGVVGIWRWSVWITKKIFSLFYRTPKGNFYSTLSIVVPVYNEDPEMFRLALCSWEMNKPDEIIAVIDYSNPELIGIFKQFAQKFAGAKLIITHKPGKRAALADGITKAKSEIVALVDSDTIWTEGLKKQILAPFSDSKVGGLTTRQDVLTKDTLARKLFKFLLDDRYLTEYPFLAVVSDAMLCLSGRTAVYRRTAIIDKLDALVNETFWGKQMISGDDKTMTNLVHAAGWKTLYLRDAKVYTPGASKISNFLKQKLRWARNGLRSDVRIIFSSWIWKHHKVLALYMLDKFVAPITLLLSPVYFAVSLSLGYWNIAAIIFIWWTISRTLKLFPHFKERPMDILLLPVYIFMTFFMAGLKIYAFFTLDKQGWITRWDTSRLSSLHPLRQAFSFFLVVAFFVGYFLAISSFQKSDHQAIKKYPGVAISQEPNLVSDNELKLAKENILSEKNNSQFGYYVIKAGDTLSILGSRLNLASTSVITYENNVPIRNTNLIHVGERFMVPVNAMQTPLNAENLLASQFSHRYPIITYDSSSNTIFLKGGGSIVTLSRISQRLAGNKKLLEQEKPGEWILRANLYIGKNVTLVVDKKEVSYLKLKSDSSGYVWILSQGGNVLISKTKITSWDEKNQTPDSNHEDGRSYITAKGSGRMDVVDSEIGYLGYIGLPRRGGLFGGSYGLSWKITNGTIKNNLLTGSVINSSIHHNYFGIYTFGATGVVIKNNEVFENIQYGIDPHDDSNNLLIVDNRVHDNGNHGIIASKRCVFNKISGNISYNNYLHGIMLDRNSDKNIVENNTVFGNRDGIAVFQSNSNIITQNKIYDNKQGIRLNQSSSYNYIDKNEIVNNDSGFHIYGQANKNFVIANNISANALGISIQNAAGNVIYDSIKASDNKKDIYITVASNENEIK